MLHRSLQPSADDLPTVRQSVDTEPFKAIIITDLIFQFSLRYLEWAVSTMSMCDPRLYGGGPHSCQAHSAVVQVFLHLLPDFDLFGLPTLRIGLFGSEYSGRKCQIRQKVGTLNDSIESHSRSSPQACVGITLIITLKLRVHEVLTLSATSFKTKMG